MFIFIHFRSSRVQSMTSDLTPDKINIILKHYLPCKIPNDLYKYFKIYLYDPINSLLLNENSINNCLDMLSKQLNISKNNIKLSLLSIKIGC